MSASRFLPGHQPLRIDRVEWRAAAPGWLAVTCIGVRGGGLPPGVPTLVLRVEAPAARRASAERFPAASAPTGDAVEWRAAFTVPEPLRPSLDEGGELEIGSLLLPLPAAVLAPAAEDAMWNGGAHATDDPAPSDEALRAARAEAAEAGAARASLERQAAERIRRLAAERDEARAALARAEEELEELRDLVARLDAAAPGPATPARPVLAPVDALTASGAPWVRVALRRLVAHDPVAAGEVMLALLPAQHLAVLGPLAYVLEVRGRPQVEVRVAGGRTWVASPAGDPAPTLRTGLRDLAALPARRGPWGWLRARGRTRRALRALGRAPLSFGALEAAEVALPAPLAYALLAVAVPPAWTAGHAFTLAHDGCLVGVGEGGILILPTPAAVPPAATVSGPPGRALAFLLGRESAAEIAGHEQAAELLQAWTRRLEAGERPRGDVR